MGREKSARAACNAQGVLTFQGESTIGYRTKEKNRPPLVERAKIQKMSRGPISVGSSSWKYRTVRECRSSTRPAPASASGLETVEPGGKEPQTSNLEHRSAGECRASRSSSREDLGPRIGIVARAAASKFIWSEQTRSAQNVPKKRSGSVTSAQNVPKKRSGSVTSKRKTFPPGETEKKCLLWRSACWSGSEDGFNLSPVEQGTPTPARLAN